MASVTKEEKKISGRRHFIYRVFESSVGASDYYTLDGVPSCGTIKLFQSELISGTATTIQPRVGKFAGFGSDTIDQIAAVSDAAEYVNIGDDVPYMFPDDVDGYAGESADYNDIVVYSMVDAGTDNLIETVIVIVEGAF